jgi:hypothetical protein
MRLSGALLATLILACLAAPESAQAQYWRDGYAPVVRPEYVPARRYYRPAGPAVWYGAYTRPYAWYPVGGVPAARPFYGAAYYTYATDLVGYYTPYVYAGYAYPYWGYGWGWPAWYGWRGFYGWGWGGCGCCC